MISRPSENEFASFFLRYISLVPESELLTVLEDQIAQLKKVAASVTAEGEKHRYAPGKWSIREVMGHLIDAERVFGYRAFCISRGEKAALPIFEENQYVAMSRYDECLLSDLVAEFELVRKGNLLCLTNLAEEGWKQMGTVGNNPMSVRAMGFIMAGHVRHHLRGLHEFYGVPAIS